MMLIVSCGEDPFFHHMTVKNYKGEDVTSFIVETGDYTFPAEMEGLSNILEWVYEGKTYDIGETVYISKNSEIKAITGIILTVDNSDGTSQPLVVKEGDKTFHLPKAPPERSGYAFDGWFVDGVLKDASAVVDFSPNIQIEAKWTVLHTVTVDNGNDTTQDLVVRDDVTTTTLPAAPAERDGYAFDGWLVDGVLKDASAVVVFSTEMQIEAKWTVLHTVTVNNGDGTTQDLIVRDDVTTTTLPAAPEERDGYVFDGWLVNGVLKDASAVVDFSPDMQVEAKWTVIYTITYDANGGSGTVLPTILRDDAANIKLSDGSGLENGVLKIYGWNTKADGSGITYRTLADYSEKADITLYAVWVNEITVTFNSKGGTAVSSQKVISGTSAAKPSTPGLRNAVFRFWSLDGVNEFSFSTPLTSDTTLYAVWKTTFAVGDRGPAGGFIFYINDQKYDNTWTYLEAQENIIIGAFTWGPERYLGCQSTGYGHGYSNTNTAYYNYMSDAERNANYALSYIKRYSSINNGITYSDWFLPSGGDASSLNKVKNSLRKADGTLAYSSGTFWTSSETNIAINGTYRSYYYDLSLGYTVQTYKSASANILPVRRF